MNQGPGIMIPPININNEPIKHILTIKPAVNGWGVILEEEIRPVRSLNPAEAEKMISTMMHRVQKSINPSEVDKIVNENELKGSQEEISDTIVPGLYIFHSMGELSAFIGFVYENHALELEKKAKEAKKALSTGAKKPFNSHMQS